MDGIRDVRMVDRLAQRKDWQVPERAYETLPADMYELASSKNTKDSTRIRAARVLALMHQQNLSRDPTVHGHVHVHGTIEEARKSLSDDAQLIELAHAKLLGHCDPNADPGGNGVAPESGQVDTGPSPGASGPSPNGCGHKPQAPEDH